MERAEVQSQPLSVPALSWSRLVTTAIAHTTEHLYIGVVTVALPVIAAAMGLGMAQAGSLVSVRYLVAGITNIPSGFLADLMPRRSSLLGLCLILLGLGSLLMSFALSYWPLLVFMAISGLGTGGFHPQSLAILSAAYRERRALALGVHDSAANLGEVIAPLTIGVLLTYTDWRTPLSIWAVQELAVWPSCALSGPASDPAPTRRALLKTLMWRYITKGRIILV